MSTNVNEAITTWNDEHAAATVELETLEETLKADYNKYVDSLAAYVARVKAANDVRDGFIRVLQSEDISNGTATFHEFVSGAENPIESNAGKYLLDTINPVEVKSPVIVAACDAAGLLERKV